MALETVYRKSRDIVGRHILDETLLVPIRGELSSLQRIFALNPVAEFVWSKLDGGTNGQAIVDGVVAEFDVEREQAEQDVSDFLKELEEAGLVVEVVPQ